MKHGHYKVVLLGDSSVGKSSIVQRFVKDSFDLHKESTIGAAFITKTIQPTPDTTVKFEIWDTAGQERYKSLTPMYYRKSHSAIIVFNLVDSQSFQRAMDWLKELQIQISHENLQKMSIKLVGNKSDLKDSNQGELTDESIQLELSSNESIKQFNIEYWETSAKTGENISQLFESIANDLPLDDITPDHDDTLDLNNNNVSLGQKCNC